MGLSESKVIADTISKACSEAADAEKIDVDALLSKKEFMESLCKVWTYVPEETRKRIGRYPKKRDRNRSQPKLRKSTIPSTPIITIPLDIMTSASDWNENPSSFFRDEGINLDLEKSPIATAYLCLENIDRRKKVDTIRARLIKTAFYRLKIRSSLRYMRSNNVDDIASIVYNSGLVRCNLDTMKRNIVRWTDQGGRINALCQSIGGSSTDEDSYLGNLFCLPEDCHDELSVTWIKTRKPRLLTIAKHKSFGYKGSYRDQQIQNIKDRGILNVQGRAVMDKLAAKVFNVLWESIRASIDAFITQSPQSALGQNLQQTCCFQTDQQTQRAVLQSDISTPNDSLSHTSDEAQEIRPSHEPLLHTTHGSAATNNLSPVSPTRQQEAPNLLFDSATNLMAGDNPHDGQTYDEVMNVDDNLQPLLLTQGHGSINGQAPIDTANVLDTHEILEPLLPAYNISPFDGQAYDEVMNVDDNLQPLLLTQGHGSINGQAPIDTANVLDTHEILEPLLPAYNISPFDGQAYNELMNVDGMFQSTPPAQTARTVVSQQPIQDHFSVPREDQLMHAQSPAFSQFTVPVSAS